jgi:hypothetical protein
MMRRSVVLPLVLSLASTFGFGTANAQSSTVIVRPLDAQSVQAGQLFSRDQIDNLVGPVALYPDPLLAQVLVASTFPDQIETAARFVRANGTRDLDDQAWDVSVKAVAHYPSTLNMMADKLDWTTSLGQAYASQSSDVMESVQRLRAMANAQGNLVSTPQQQVVVNEGYYEILPAQPRVIYVPVYDPFVIYTRPVFYAGGFGGYWSFGIGFPIGAWLSYDCDWRGGRVYYDGWSDRGWRSRSRPYVNITNVYVNRRFENVYVNHAVRQRPVNYREVDRYRSVHPDTPFGGRERDHANPGRGGERNGNVGRGNESRDNPVRGNPGRDNQGNGNRIINRGPDVRDPRMNASRSREPERSTPTVRVIPGPPASAPRQPEARSPQPAPRAAPPAERRRPESREAGRGRQEGDKKERDRKP